MLWIIQRVCVRARAECEYVSQYGWERLKESRQVSQCVNKKVGLGLGVKFYAAAALGHFRYLNANIDGAATTF